MFLYITNDRVMPQLSAPSSDMFHSISPVIHHLANDKCVEQLQQHQRRVRFHDVECEEDSVSVDSLYEEPDHNLLWYQKEDLRQFKKNNKKLIRDYRLMMKRIRQSSSALSIEQLIHLNDDIRGLEIYSSSMAQRDAKNRRIAITRAVLLEQWHQKRTSMMDPKRLRKVSLSMSKASKIIAYSLAKTDESYVRQTMKTERAIDRYTRVQVPQNVSPDNPTSLPQITRSAT